MARKAVPLAAAHVRTMAALCVGSIQTGHAADTDDFDGIHFAMTSTTKRRIAATSHKPNGNI
jgi:hypothetical protein